MFLPGNVNVNSSDMSDSRSDRTRFSLLKGRGVGQRVAANSALQSTDSPSDLLSAGTVLLYRRNHNSILELTPCCNSVRWIRSHIQLSVIRHVALLQGTTVGNACHARNAGDESLTVHKLRYEISSA